MNIGQSIKVLRKEKGITQKGLSELCGLSQTSLSAIEKDYSFPSKDNLTKICKALGISKAYLLFSCLEESD